MKSKILIIVGPTASGKSDTAVKFARSVNASIISCDSMQVYKLMPIITQQPLPEIMAEIPHYLVNELAPDQEYSAAIFKKSAEKTIADIIKNRRLPIIAGGTGLYLKALIDGLFPAPSKDEVLRGRLEKEAEEKGVCHLHDQLKKHDPESAEKIHPNDKRRIIRALEIFYSTGISKTTHSSKTEGIKDKYDIVFLGINPPRDELYERINKRVDLMFDSGAVEEVRELLKKKISVTARSALGISEISDYLEGNITLEAAKELLKQNTRRYAKRQLTWFRADKRIRWFRSGEELLSEFPRIIA